MKIKTILGAIAAFLLINVFFACDDDLNSVGDSIQPLGDNVIMGTDSFVVTARTIALDRVFVSSTASLLGKYDDPVFGSIRADYLSEIYIPDSISFEDRAFAVDSVTLSLVSQTYTGDSTATMGLAAYEVTNYLEKNYYSDINPADYCDISTANVLTRSAYSVATTPVSSDGYRTYSFPMDTTLVGHRFLNEWQTRPETFRNSNNFRDFFKGMYITTNMGSGSLLDVVYTYIIVYYRYNGRNVADTSDSIRTSAVRLTTSPTDVIQMNRIQSTYPAYMLTEGTGSSYIKSPAGLYTELKIPIGKIMARRKEKGYTMMNAAALKILSNAEKEAETGLSAPSTLLLVNSDSINTFFETKSLPNNKTSLIVSRTTTTNSYSLSNISLLIEHYIDKYEAENSTIDESLTLKYCLVPVGYDATTSYDYYGSSYLTYTSVYHQMKPAAAILRTGANNLKLALIQSKYYK